MGYTRGHLHERVEGHKHQSSSISHTIIACTGRSRKTYLGVSSFSRNAEISLTV